MAMAYRDAHSRIVSSAGCCGTIRSPMRSPTKATRPPNGAAVGCVATRHGDAVRSPDGMVLTWTARVTSRRDHTDVLEFGKVLRTPVVAGHGDACNVALALLVADPADRRRSLAGRFHHAVRFGGAGGPRGYRRFR